MRIFFDHQVFSLQNTGGGSRYFYELMRYFSTVPGVQAEALLGISGTAYPFRSLPPAKVRVTMWKESLPPGSLRYAVNESISNSMLLCHGKVDIYHATHHRLLPTVRSRKVVVTHHDCTHERFPAMVRHAKQVMRAKKRLYERADAIICVSEASRADLLEFYGTDVSKTRVIHHGVTPLARSTEAARQLRERVGREYLLFVGKRGLYKNGDSLIRAFHDTGLYNCLDLVFLGGGPLSPEEIGMLDRLGIGDSVINFPTASDELLAEGYAAAKLFVYPSLWEGFGFPPLEAMAASCPVLASRTSSIPEVCSDAPFYFDPQDQDSLGRELLRAVHDVPARRLAVKRGREVAAGYTWEKCGAQTLAFYQECL